MAEAMHVFEQPVTFEDTTYVAQVCGRPAGHIWEGWIEFAATDGSAVRRTRRETTQPNREALVYWATGISPTYLEGAIARTFDAPPARVEAVARANFDAPAPAVQPRRVVVDHAVLDPFSVGAKGERLLRQELGALADWHLRNIIRAYDLADDSVDVEALAHSELVELIVSAVEPS